MEEVVRREEKSKSEKQLSSAKEDWKKERQKLFQEAHQTQLRAIARQSSLLEEKLRKEFAGTLQQITRDHSQELEKMIEKTWEEADLVTLEAVDKVRLEEQASAREEALTVAARVAEEKKCDSELAEETRMESLAKQKEQLDMECTQALARQNEDLELEFKDRMSNICEEYDTRLEELQKKYDEQLALSQQLQADLKAMTDLKVNWESKYTTMRAEFSDFIDQFPGFRGEFILK